MKNYSKIVIENHKFDFNTGCRLLKLKSDVCPFKELEGIWDDIEPLTFKDIAQFTNIEERRIGMLFLGLDRLVKQVKPKLLDTKTIKKETTWVNEEGELIHKKFNDTYELYEVSGKSLGLDRWGREGSSQYYIKCKDTSTNREYLIWVDLRDVYRTNNDIGLGWDFEPKKVDSIECIAWTIQTNVPEKNIKEIIRQGDCILIKPKGKYEPLETPRHLTKKEYLELLVCES